MAVRLTVDKAIDSRNITRYRVSQDTGINYQLIDNYYKNRLVRYDSFILNTLCEYLKCDISDLIEYKKDAEQPQK